MLLNYHQLPAQEQRLYRYFIKGCQNPALLTIGGLAPLNMATCVTVCNYSIDKTFNNNYKFKFVDTFFICRFSREFIQSPC